MDEVLRVDSVTKRYGDVLAVDRSSFEVEVGTFVALLGPSGCGKTTTLRLIAGFEQPDQGSIWIAGQEMRGVPVHKRPVNTVFQEFALFPHMTVFDNVAFGPRLQNAHREETRRRVEEVLRLVRLSDMEERRPHELSGGQQQRVALARALINKPKMLLLDEPLSNLDYKLRKEMRLELKRIARQVRTTFILVTHDQEEALTLADHIIVMNAGRIQQKGTPEELYRRPSNLFVADFIGSANFLEGTLIGGDGGRAEVAISGIEGNIAAPHSGLRPGTPVVLCVRSERIIIDPRSAENGAETVDNIVTGTVEETGYLGDHSEILVSVGDVGRLRCEYRHVNGEGPRFGVGARLTVGWSSAATFLFECPGKPER